MNLKTQMIAFAVRLIADNTTLISKPSGFEAFLSSITEEETYDIRIARNVEENLVRATNRFKQINTDRKFKKIVEHD